MNTLTIEMLREQNLILFEAVSGSRAFGLHTETSDTDIKGVFYLPVDHFLGLEYTAQVSNESNDIVFYELGRFVELLLKNNPNILELLASPDDCVLYKHPIMEQLVLKDFLSKLCKDSFANYAITQIKKARGLNKKIVNPVPKERKTILDFCFILKDADSVPLNQWLENENYKQEHCGLVQIPHSKGMHALFYSSAGAYKGIMRKEQANEVCLSSVTKGEVPLAYMLFNQEAYSTYCKQYKEYWKWMETRNEERYRTNMAHGQNYDSKNMMHTIRLLQTTEQIFTTGTLNVRVHNREELLSVKNGTWSYDDILIKAEALIQSIDAVFQTSDMPELPDTHKAIPLLVTMRKEIYFTNFEK
jgi:hypothetical protein